MSVDHVERPEAGSTGAPADPRASRWVVLGPIRVLVPPGVFPPHRDTMAVIDWCVGALRGVDHPVIVDLCTGSGVIALALATEYPDARICAIDRSATAVRAARANADRLLGKAARRIETRQADTGALGSPAESAGAADLVVANPPYLPDGQPAPPDLAAWAEPHALHGGRDGLDVIRGVVRSAVTALRPGGLLALEHGAGQQDAVQDLLDGSGAFDAVTGRRDHAGAARFVTARRR